MQKYNLNALIEFDEKRFNPKVLMSEPGFRMVFLMMRAGQLIPEHASKEMVTVQAILGHVTLFAGSLPDELYAGEIICIESGVPHRIEANEDSALLVLSTLPPDPLTAHSKELDLFQFPRPQLPPLLLERFDTLALGESFFLTADHNPVLVERELENTRPGQATWEHLNRGPVKYRIRIRRVAPAHVFDALVATWPEELLREIHNTWRHTPDVSTSSMIPLHCGLASGVKS